MLHHRATYPTLSSTSSHTSQALSLLLLLIHTPSYMMT